MPEKNSYIAPGWDQIYDMLLDLASMVRKSGFTPDCIVGISRGGWTPARIMSDFLENPNTANMKVEFYLGIGKTARKPVITQPVTSVVKDKKILLVDDVADTGESLKVALDHLVQGGARAVKTATIYYKPQSTTKPDFFVAETSSWIIFPWERLETTRLLLDQAKKKGKGEPWVRENLVKGGLEKATVDKLLQFVRGGS